MTYLLDTHAFIWMASSPEKLSSKARAAILDASNELWLSTASLWEMQIKCGMGKLTLELPLNELWKEAGSANDIGLIKIETSHIWQLELLPYIHKDPFDRLLVSQAQCEKLTLISRDGHIKEYNVQTIW